MVRQRSASLVRWLTQRVRRAALLALLSCAWLLTSSQAFAVPADEPGVGETLAAPNATFTVSALDDHNDGTCDADCTLIEAIAAANAAGGANTVVLPINATFLLTQVNNSTPTLGANGLPVITANLTVNGNGALIARNPTAPDFRFFQVGAGASLTLNQVTLLNGYARVGTSLGRDGGCILETGSGGVTLYQSSLEDCTAADEGGAVYSDTSLTLDSSTVSMTSTTAHTVVVNSGSALIRNSTLTGNTGSTGLVVNAGTVAVTESTIAFNNAGLIVNGGAVTVTQSIIGGNSVAQVTGSYTDGAGNYIGAAPQLSPLRYWGGPTKTHYPTPGSPARDISGGCAAATDQRGARRAAFGNALCDAGAVEASDFAVTTTADSGAGSLRQAILNANSTPDLQVIYFSIGLPGVVVIQPTDANPLPDITDPVVIDGLTQGGSANTGTTSLSADLRIVIDGGLLTTNVNGLRLAAPNNVIRGLVINRVAPLGFFLNADGIEVASSGNRIEGNYIGTNPTGAVAQPNSYAGVRITADNNIVGGRTSDAKNLLSGNVNQGVTISNASHNVVQGNFIGVNAAGTARLTQGYGVTVVLGGSANTVGGPLVGQRNVIAGHDSAGIYTVNPSTQLRVIGNYIGTSSDGTAALGNLDGIEINGSDGNIIGGPVATTPGGACTGDCNLLSGNTGNGISVYSAADNLRIQGNYIGVNAAGTGALANGAQGIYQQGGGTGGLIGGTTPATRNVIAGNSQAGILLTTGISGHTIQGNYIGVFTGGVTAGANGAAGIHLDGASNTTIGGTLGTTPGGACTGACNLIAGNTGPGIQVVNSSTTTVQGNFIGADVSGTLDRGNGMAGVLVNGSPASIIGGTTAAARNLVSGNGAEGVHLLNAGATNSTVQGNFIGTDTTGTAGLGNTGYGVHIQNAPTTTVGGTTGTTPGGACTGACNLIARNSIGVYIEGNGASGNSVRGNFIGTDVNGTAALNNTSEGVLINQAPNNTIGGTTAAARNVISGNGTFGIQIANGGAAGNTVQGNYIGVDTTGAVVLGNGNNGLIVAGAANSTIGGTVGTTPGGACTGACNVIAGNGADGIFLASGANGTLVRGNFIGTDVSGALDRGNGVNGITVSSASGVVIGTGTAAGRNLISANTQHGIQMYGAASANNVIQGNFIGTTTSGLGGLGNVEDGIRLETGANQNTVGGTAGTTPGGACTGTCNLLADNGQYGISIVNPGADSNIVIGNFIGTDVTGTTDLGNDSGVYIASGATLNRVGTNGDAANDLAERNLVSGNYSAGILIEGDGTANNVVAGNYVGVDTTGLVALGNDDGVRIGAGAQNNHIGTDGSDDAWNSAERNVIAGNAAAGVLLIGPNANDNVVAGNYIGVDATGGAALPNQTFGVAIMVSAQNNRIGANSDGVADADERNVIAGNYSEGVYIEGTGSTGNVVAGNYIGTDATGTVNLPNLSAGVYIVAAPNNTIGGTAAGAGNLIRGNTREGVTVRYAAATGNRILGNSISQNGALGIDLNPTGLDPTGDGVTLNDGEDADAGPNNLQNFPVLRQVTVGDSDTFALFTLDGEAGAGFRVEFFANTACDASGHGEGQTYLGFTTVTTDVDGMARFAGTLPFTVPVGAFITATATDAGDNTSEFSACQLALGNNQSWSQATRIPLTPIVGTPSLIGQTAQYLVTGGGSAWYKFSLQPHAQVTVDLTGLPADYDLALYRDPNIEYNRLTQPITAVEIAARAAPEGFLPEGFLPEGFLPEGFLPEGFLPEGFLPEGFLPEGFLRERFQPSDPAPSSAQPEPYALAEWTSLLAVSAGEGTRSERILRNTYDSQGDWYIQVRAKPGVSSLTAPFQLSVEVQGDFCGSLAPLSGADPLPPAGPPSYKTIILTNLSRLPGSAEEKTTLQTALTTFRLRAEVSGVLVDLAEEVGGQPLYPRVAQAYADVVANRNCPLAKNMLADEIKKVVDAYRQTHPLEYVVMIGNDDVVPFFRTPDLAGLADEKGYYPPVLESTHSQSSLRLSQVLGQDEYGASITAVRNGFTLRLPDLAVGRLVETAGEAAGMLQTYLDNNGVLAPTTGLVTGYDFVADVANAVKDDLTIGLARPVDTLIQPEGQPPTASTAWTAGQLRTAFLDSRHDIAFLAGHFSAVGTEAADYRTRLSSAEVAESAVDLANAFVYSVGCHSGYNIVDVDGVPAVTQEPDWAQTFARKRVTSVMGTGYQYGDTEFIEYSERLYYLLTRQLRTGDGPRPVGKALVQAKRDYLAAVPQMRGLHEKALRVATLYGLPMYSINLPGPRLSPGAPASLVTALSPVVTGPGLPYLLSTADITVTTNVVSQTKTLVNTSDNSSVTTTYFEGREGVVVNPLEPVLPLQIENVTYPDLTLPKQTLRGVGSRGGPYTDWPDLTPLTGAPTTELSVPHPAFGSSVFYPSLLWSVNYFDAFTGGKTWLDLFPAQFKSDTLSSTSGVFRTYNQMKFRLFYSNETGPAGMAPPPTITSVYTSLAPDTVHFTVVVDGQASAGVQQVWLLYTAAGGPLYGEWRPLDLTTVVPKAAQVQTWTGALVLPPNQRAQDLVFVVQAANGVGGVRLDTNGGQQYHVQMGDPPPPPTLETTLSLSLPPSGAYRDTRTFTAMLLHDETPVPNQTIRFSLGGTLREALTDASGVASFPITLTQLPNSYEVAVEFKGGSPYLPSLATGSYSVEKQGTTITLASTESLPVTRQYSDPTTFAAVLNDDAARPIAAKTVFFVLTGSNGQDAVHDITTNEGRATMEAPALPAGTYSITAYFAGALPAVTGQAFIEDARYLPSSSTAATSAFIITPETASVAYTGQTSILVGSPLQLTATVGQDDDDYPGDLRRAQVHFVIKDGQNATVATRTVTADANGLVTDTVQALAVGHYIIETQVQGGYFQSPLVTTPLVVNAPVTVTPTVTATATPVATTTATATATATSTATATATSTATTTATVTATAPAASTATATVTATALPASTATATATRTATTTATVTATAPAASTATATPTATVTATAPAASTATATPTRTPTRPPQAPAKPALFRNGVWFLRTTLTDGLADLVFSYGLASDAPLMCDWDGNGSKTPGVFRDGAWYLKNANTSGVSDSALRFGLPGDTPVCGDWDGDGVETPGVVRGAVWYLRNSNTSGVADLVVAYGVPTDKPVVGDWNGDGVDTPGVFRDGVWFFRNSNTNGTADLFFSYGVPPGDTPLVGDWNADGVDTPAVLRGSYWLLRNSNTPGGVDISFHYGLPGDKMLVWR